MWIPVAMQAVETALFEERLTTPIGTAVVLTDAAGALRVVDFDDYEHRMALLLDRHYGRGSWSLSPAPGATKAASALNAYFAGDIAAIDGLPTATNGTAFQRSVWTALRSVPAGAPQSYSDIAQAIGKPSATRAVGLANGANPVAIVVPCHRVIGRSGALTGYGGGLHRKRWLLAHEAEHTARDLFHRG